jgi:hypothetical protein
MLIVLLLLININLCSFGLRTIFFFKKKNKSEKQELVVSNKNKKQNVI